MKTLSIVIPVFNNSGSLNLLFEKLKETESKLNSLRIMQEVIFVDDGSTDDSLNLLISFQKTTNWVKVIKLTRNFGALAATKRGLSHVTGDCFTILAADLQDPPELVPVMAEQWLKGNKYIIFERESREDPAISKLFSKIYYKLLRFLVLPNYPKGGFDIALMDRSMLLPIVESSKNVLTPLIGFWLGFTPITLMYHRPARKSGKSSWTFRKKIKTFSDVFLGFSATPIRILSLFGLLISLLSFSYGIAVVFTALSNKIPVEGFATLAALISFLLGLILLMLGLLGEYLWRILEEINKRPESVVEQVWET